MMVKTRDMFYLSLVFLSLLFIIGGFISCDSDNSSNAQQINTYEVIITNLTRFQTFSPPVVASHNKSFQIFGAGEIASPGLEDVAEIGFPGTLLGELAANANVFDAVAAVVPMPMPLTPGNSLALEVTATEDFPYISAVGMLVITNDAFFGLNSVEVGAGVDTVIVEVPAYDAGTEVNDEECANFPPLPPPAPVPSSLPGMCPAAPAAMDEGGFIHVHTGMHGASGLDPSEVDWRNPVARIQISRK